MNSDNATCMNCKYATFTPLDDDYKAVVFKCYQVAHRDNDFIVTTMFDQRLKFATMCGYYRTETAINKETENVRATKTENDREV